MLDSFQYVVVQLALAMSVLLNQSFRADQDRAIERINLPVFTCIELLVNLLHSVVFRLASLHDFTISSNLLFHSSSELRVIALESFDLLLEPIQPCQNGIVASLELNMADSCVISLLQFVLLRETLVRTVEQTFEKLINQACKRFLLVTKVESSQMAQVSKSKAMHAAHQLFLAVIELQACFLVFHEEVKLLYQERQLCCEGHIQTFATWIDHLIELYPCAVFVFRAQVPKSCFKLQYTVIRPDLWHFCLIVAQIERCIHAFKVLCRDLIKNLLFAVSLSSVFLREPSLVLELVYALLDFVLDLDDFTLDDAQQFLFLLASRYLCELVFFKKLKQSLRRQYLIFGVSESPLIEVSLDTLYEVIVDAHLH